MLAQIPLNLDRWDWGTWVVPVVGLIAAGLMLIMTRTFLGWRHVRLHTMERDATLVGKAIGSSRGDRGGSVRRPGKIVKVWITDADATAEPFQGWIHDRSMGGLSITVYRSVDIDTIVSVRSTDADALAPWVQLHVTRCSAQGEGHWELGCQFVRTPSYNQLLSFG
jgi:hypothetical protein